MNPFHNLDPQNMFQSIYDFPDHILKAIEIGNAISLSQSYSNIQNIVIAGMCGSAIGGDIAKTLTNN